MSTKGVQPTPQDNGNNANPVLFCLSFVALTTGWNQGMQNAALLLLLLLESGVWRPEVKSLSCCCDAGAIEVVLE
ncbi:unnamed protein product [Linum trigynum]|uniref:Uncharacterized protein n=1 Tax=Linum trigynum TaxID=586398 RepID=A0AAV2DY63_9ROSI